MKRTILSLSLVLALALFTNIAFADDAPEKKAEKPAASEKAETDAKQPAAKLSVEPQETETELPLDATAAEVAASGGLTDKVKSGFTREPLLWSIVALVLSFLGYRGAKGALSHASDVTSKGEVFGMTVVGGGFLAFTNGIARAFDWSQVNITMIAGGLLALVIGIGFATQANEDRRNDKEASK